MENNNFEDDFIDEMTGNYVCAESLTKVIRRFPPSDVEPISLDIEYFSWEEIEEVDPSEMTKQISLFSKYCAKQDAYNTAARMWQAFRVRLHVKQSLDLRLKFMTFLFGYQHHDIRIHVMKYVRNSTHKWNYSDVNHHLEMQNCLNNKIPGAWPAYHINNVINDENNIRLLNTAKLMAIQKKNIKRI